MLTRSHILLGNVGLNFISQVILIAVFMVATPVIIHGLGPAAFGTLSIVWTLMGYFGFLDLGVTAATTKFVAEHLGRGEPKEISRVVLSSLSVNLALGLIGAAILAALTPLFVSKIFVVPNALQADARFALYVLALSFPFILAQSILQGSISAYQRFDIINLINTVVGAGQGIIGMYVVTRGGGLREIVIVYQAARVLACLAFLIFLLQLIPPLPFGPFWRHPSFGRLMKFGGWVTASSIAFPLLFSTNPFLIGSWMTVAAVTYYAVPWGVVSRMGIIPRSVSTVLYPEFGKRGATDSLSDFKRLFFRSMTLLFFTMLPAALVLCVFPREILGLWVGPDFASKSTTTLRLLTVGTVANALAGIAGAAVRGLGRPDLCATFDAIETVLFLALDWILIPLFGVSGAALAWTFTMTLDLALLLAAAIRLTGVADETTFQGAGAPLLIGGLFFAIPSIAEAARRAIPGVAAYFGFVAAVGFAWTSLYGWVCWKYVLDDHDREAFGKITLRLFRVHS